MSEIGMRRLGLGIVLVGFALGAALHVRSTEVFAARPVARPRLADPVRVPRTDMPAPVVLPPADPPVSPDPWGAPEAPGASLESAEIASPTIRTPELDCTPVEAAGYRRGRRTPITVVRIDGEPVERTTANAYWNLREAAAADGVELTIFSAFRTQEQQQYFYDCFRSCSCNNCSPAAKPGHSNHQMGRAVDIAQWPGVHDWLVANAGRFGFSATVPSEPWHWELRRGTKPARTLACPRD